MIDVVINVLSTPAIHIHYQIHYRVNLICLAGSFQAYSDLTFTL
jgi:hypothetical protein